MCIRDSSEEILEHIEQQAEQVGNNKGGSSGTNDPGDDEDELLSLIHI